MVIHGATSIQRVAYVENAISQGIYDAFYTSCHGLVKCERKYAFELFTSQRTSAFRPTNLCLFCLIPMRFS